MIIFFDTEFTELGIDPRLIPHLGFDQIKSMPERLRDESVMPLLSNVEEEAMGEEDTPRFRPS